MEQSYPPGRMGPTDTATEVTHDLLQVARELLDGPTPSAGVLERDARLHVLRRGDRNTVFRAVAPPGAPGRRSVVLKLAARDSELAEADSQCMLALTGLGVVPDVLVDTRIDRGYAMVDVGDDTLERIFRTGSRAQAVAAMRHVGAAYARLHVEGRSLIGRTAALRERALTRELGRWMDGIPRAVAWLGLDAGDARVRRALARVTAVWYAPREALTLTHGDPAPSNVLLDGDSARLIDFEYGAARHPLYDVTAWDVLCPLPPSVVQHFRAAYEAERAALGWPLGTGSSSDHAAMVIYRAFALLSWLPAEARERDESWVEGWTAREAVVSTLERVASCCEPDADLRPLAEVAAERAAAWRRAWPEVGHALPPWPALREMLA